MNTSLSTLAETLVHIPCEGPLLDGNLAIPADPSGLVIFAHGSGSSRLSPRNRMVADEFHRRGLATLLFDLLTPSESAAEAGGAMRRFDIPFLTARLLAATRWAQSHPPTRSLGIGYFGSSTGAAAALCAADLLPEIQAVVSRGGRTDLAGNDATRVAAPTLLIAGELDQPVLAWNHATLDLLPGLKHLTVIAGASHLFHEAGTLERVADHAAAWFKLHLSTLPPKPSPQP